MEQEFKTTHVYAAAVCSLGVAHSLNIIPSSFNSLLSAEHGAASGVWSPGQCDWCGPGAAAVAATLTATGPGPANTNTAATWPGVCDVTRPGSLLISPRALTLLGPDTKVLTPDSRHDQL